MSTVYNPEAETIARIEALEMEVRNMRRRIEHAHTPADKRVLNRQMNDLQHEIGFLRHQVDRLGGNH